MGGFVVYGVVGGFFVFVGLVGFLVVFDDEYFVVCIGCDC